MANEPLFTPAQISADGKNAVQRTNGQAGLGAAAVIAGIWIARQLGWNGEMPEAVVASFTVIATWAAARWANRDKINATKT